MSAPLLYSLVESPTHPDFSALYRELEVETLLFTSLRKAIASLKKRPPDLVIGEFFYGYGNNYAGVNIGNLDTFLASLQKYAPQARVLVMVQKAERPHLERLAQRFPIQAVLEHPVSRETMDARLREQLKPS